MEKRGHLRHALGPCCISGLEEGPAVMADRRSQEVQDLGWRRVLKEGIISCEKHCFMSCLSSLAGAHSIHLCWTFLSIREPQVFVLGD